MDIPSQTLSIIITSPPTGTQIRTRPSTRRPNPYAPFHTKTHGETDAGSGSSQQTHSNCPLTRWEKDNVQAEQSGESCFIHDKEMIETTNHQITRFCLRQHQLGSSHCIIQMEDVMKLSGIFIWCFPQQKYLDTLAST